MPPGRPRSAAAKTSILDAVREELTESGYDRLTVERVALRAGVAKQTVYRWYKTKNALVADSLLQGFVGTPSIALHPAHSAEDSMREWVEQFMRITADNQSMALIRAAQSAAADDIEVARGFQSQVKTMARDSLASRIEAGVVTGEIKSGTSPLAVAEILVGSLLYRLTTHELIDQNFVEELLDTLLFGIKTSAKRKS